MDPTKVNQVAKALSELKPGLLPLPIFLQTARLTVTPIIELVPLRQSNPEVEVLLIRRDADDPIWPNQWHTPGTVVRADDREGSWDDPLQRLLTEELGNPQIKHDPRFVEIRFGKTARGKTVTQVFSVEVSNAVNGQWFPANQLPDDFVDSLRPIVQNAVQVFRQSSI